MDSGKTWTSSGQTGSWPADTNETRPLTFAERVDAARQATLDLYLEDPNPESAHLIQVFEETVRRLLYERSSKQKD